MIFVFDAKSETQIGTISVPGGWMLDQAPDGSAIFAGTTTGDIYVVDPQALTVKERIVASTIGPSGYHAWGAFMLADGRFVLVGDPAGSGGDSFDSFAIWDRSTNALTTYVLLNGQLRSLAGQRACGSLRTITNIALNAARTNVFFGDSPFCRFDPSSGDSVTADPVQSGGTLLPTPDGKQFLTFSLGNVYIWDASSMKVIDQYAMPPYSSGPSLLSRDGNVLYTVGVGFNTGIVTAYQWRTHTFLGWTNVPVPVYNGDLTPMAIDETGLIGGVAGIVDGGFGFTDVSSLQSAPSLTNDLLSTMRGPYATTQNVVSTSGGTTVEFGKTPVGQSVTALYVDHQLVPNFTTKDGSVLFSAPPHAPGPVDVAVKTSSGAVLTAFSAFSYGLYVTQQSGTLSTAEGGGTSTLMGYGFYDNTGQSNLQIQVGGRTVPITTSFPNWNGARQVLQFTIPPGPAGSTAPITISNSFGTITTPTPITYLPSIQKFPLPGASLAQGVYDPKHRLYYFTDRTQIRVFSRSSLSWRAPITLPNPGFRTQELVALSLSPDGNKLAVSDDYANRIYVLDTNNPTSVQSFDLPSTGLEVNSFPTGLAISDTGVVYYASYQLGGAGDNTFHKLDTSTGIVTPYKAIPAVNQYEQYDSHVLISRDNANVYYLAPQIGSYGFLYSVSTATDEGSYLPGACSNTDMALSPDGHTLAAGNVFFDSNAIPRAHFGGDILFAVQQPIPVQGEKFSADGKLLFQPEEQSILVIDSARALPLDRIGLPVKLSLHFDALVSNGVDNVLVAITDPGDGIALIDLSAVPEPGDQSISPSAALFVPSTLRSTESPRPELSLPTTNTSQTMFASGRRQSFAASMGAGQSRSQTNRTSTTPVPATGAVNGRTTDEFSLASDAADSTTAQPRFETTNTSESNANRTQNRAVHGPALLSEALSLFPETTTSLEYDNLIQLRNSPDYEALREQYSGPAFKRLASLLSKIGLTEANVGQIVNGSNGLSFYGMVQGTFSRTNLMRQKLPSGVRLSAVGSEHALCSDDLCLLFVSNSAAAFGSQSDVHAMHDRKEGQSTSLASNPAVIRLFAAADLAAPVIGLGPGTELTSWISNSLASGLAPRLSAVSSLTAVNWFEYSVTLGTKARVNMYLDCSSSLVANTLSASIRSFNALSSLAAGLANKSDSFPFGGVNVQASQNRIHITLEADVP